MLCNVTRPKGSEQQCSATVSTPDGLYTPSALSTKDKTMPSSTRKLNENRKGTRLGVKTPDWAADLDLVVTHG